MSNKNSFDYTKWPHKCYNNYEIVPMRNGIDLDVDTFDQYYGPNFVTLNAVEVYNTLKEYFKGTEYE